MKNFRYSILPIFFFGTLYFFFFNQIFQWKVFKDEAENRALAKYPKLYFKNPDIFPKQFDDYLNDNFTFRVPFVNLYHDFKFALGISPNQTDVIIGNNGHFFLAQKDQQIQNGEFQFDALRLDSMMQVWKIKSDYLKELDIPFYWLVAPNKHHVYADYLPINIKKEKVNRTLALARIFHQQFPNHLIYSLDEMLKDREYAYYKHDNHWTNKGAFISYQQLMKMMQLRDISIKSIPDSAVQWKKVNWDRGNLLNFLGKEGDLIEDILVAEFPTSAVKEAEKFKFKATDGFPYPWEYEFHFTNKKALNKKKLLVIRDSFGGAIMPFFNETFSETVYIFDAWKYAINKQIIEEFKPDLVVFLSLETNVDNILLYPQLIDKE